MGGSTIHPEERSSSHRVLVLAPVDGDARAVSQVLGQGGFEAVVCLDVSGIAAEIGGEEGAGAGVVIVAQEALGPEAGEEHRRLSRVLSSQPAWSDLPLILLAGSAAGEDGAWAIARGLDPLGNITILERPLRRTTLLNAVAVALRARARQYELRSTLGELARHKENLREMVEQKTAELARTLTNLHAAERLASLGTLATGLGHDIANLTLPIRMRLDALALCTTEEGKADVDAIGVAMAHMGQLSAGMRLLGIDPERVDATMETRDLEAWARETTPMFRAALPRHVRFECHVESGLGVSVHRHRLAQAVFNIVQNAGEALAARESGEVRLRVERAEDERDRAMVRIRVSDDGPGMTQEVLAHCFEPYFSTKGRAIATGMGLGMVKGIVEAAHGTVSVESTPGRGTSFTIILPPAQIADQSEGAELGTYGAAITLKNQRVAKLVEMFLEHLHVRCLRHGGTGIPRTQMWIADECDKSRLDDYLSGDPGRRAVLVGNGAPCGGETSGSVERVLALPEMPAPAVLRDAISWALVRSDRAEGK